MGSSSTGHVAKLAGYCATQRKIKEKEKRKINEQGPFAPVAVMLEPRFPCRGYVLACSVLESGG